MMKFIAQIMSQWSMYAFSIKLREIGQVSYSYPDTKKQTNLRTVGYLKDACLWIELCLYPY